MKAFDKLKSFQIGGAINMNEEKKKELFPYFAYVYSQKLNPEKYGTVTSLEEWTALIQDNPDDINVITEAAGQLSNDDWEAVAQQYEEAQAGEKGGLTKEPQLAAKGAKLKKLKESAIVKKGSNKFAVVEANKETVKAISKPVITQGKDGMKTKKKKKCSCGCDMILSKAIGGQVIETCSCKCGGKIKKKK